MMKNTDSLVRSLKEVVQCCQDMQGLLQADYAHFTKNDLAALEQNNQNKAELISQLSTLMDQLNVHYAKDHPGGFLEQVEADISSLDPAAQKEVGSALGDLKSEIAKCYHSILTNSHIVFANLRQLKELWDKLLAREPSMACVYDQKGHTTE